MNATNTYAQRIGGIAPQVEQQYGQAKTEQAGLDAALTGLAQGQGQAAYGQLAGALGQAGAPADAVQASAGQLQGLGQGAAEMLGGAGASTLSRLISQGAADTTYAQELPGFARMQGQAGLQGFQNMLNTLLSDKTGEIQAQIPGMVESTYQSNLSRNDQNASARLGFISDALSRNLSGWTAAQGLGLDYAKLGQDQNQFLAGLANQTDQTAAGAGGLTPAQIAAQNTDAYANLYNFGVSMFTPGIGQTPASNIAAYKRMFQYASGMPAYKGMGKWDLLKLVRQALVAAGYQKAADAPAGYFFGTATPSKPKKQTGPAGPQGTTPGPAGPQTGK